MKNILVLNCGSSSIKYKLFEMSAKKVVANGGIEKIGMSGSFIKFSLPNGEKKIEEMPIPEHTKGVEIIFSKLTDPEIGVLKSLNELDAVGHRMLHGGSKITKSSILTKEVLDIFEACSDMGPLHNPANLKGVNAVKALLPNIPQVGVFDTAFHQTMPDYAYMYALPYEFYEKFGIRRYGFHGTSHKYVSRRVCEYLGVDPVGKKIITCHIGNGGSISAIVDGKCVDTSMGLTPLEGLMMGTRCGDIDPAIIPYIMHHTNMTIDEIDTMMNKKSGLLGVSGTTSDMREIQAARDKGDKRAALAQDMYYYRVRKYIGEYAAAMGGVDILLFTGGVGENKFDCREVACRGLEFMGIELDVEKNKTIMGEEAIISKPSSKVTVCVIPTDEELMIAMDTDELTK
ncbi:MAG: acetate kinase [Bacteroidales bacterium]|nr:acetate kinase [Bacteroidales bacterium]MDY4521090.1 acetate kinase [Bacteroidales bacterium]